MTRSKDRERRGMLITILLSLKRLPHKPSPPWCSKVQLQANTTCVKTKERAQIKGLGKQREKESDVAIFCQPILDS